MRLEGIHHVTAITGDAPGNVDFYVRVLGLRLVKKTVNQDDPTVYHLFYSDERGSAGADITFFEYPGARRGRAGAGMVHRVVFRVGSEEALDFWAERLAKESVSVSRADGSLTFTDPEGLGLELAVVATDDEPLTAENPEIPAEHRIQGFARVRAFTRDPERAARSSRRRSSSTHPASRAGRFAASTAAASTSTTARRSAAFPARAPSTTSPGPRPPRSTRRGGSASSQAAAGRPR